MKKKLHLLLAFVLFSFANTTYSQTLIWEECGSMNLSTSGSANYFNNTKTFTGVALSNTDVQIAIGILGCSPYATNSGGIQLNGTTFIETNVPVQNCGVTVAVNNYYTISQSVFNQAVIDGGGTIVFSNYIRDTCAPGTGCSWVNDPCIKMNVEYTVLSTESFDKPSFLAFPNPVKDILNLSFDKEITAVSIHNLLGQEVFTKAVNSNESKIDISNVISGTYIVKVTSVNGETKTLKIIKE